MSVQTQQSEYMCMPLLSPTIPGEICLSVIFFKDLFRHQVRPLYLTLSSVHEGISLLPQA
jgi:hypothetical protein